MLWAAFFVFITISDVNAQSQVFLTPEQANGFVAWIDSDTSGIEYWEAVVYERVPNADSTIYNEERVWRHEEWRNNFIYIPEEYRPEGVVNKYGIFLYGKDASHQIIVEEEILPFLCTGCDTPELYATCFQICNSGSYAWKVTQFVNPGNSKSWYQLTGASHYDPNYVDEYTLEEGGYVPYYQYMTNLEYAGPPFLESPFINGVQEARIVYDIPANVWDIIDLEDYYSYEVENSPEIDYYTISGTYIQNDIETFMGVRKAMGHWNDVEYMDSWVPQDDWTSGFAYGTWGGLCLNNSIEYAMDIMNMTISNVYPTLTCEVQANMSDPGSGWSGDLSECTDELLEDFDDYPDIGSPIQNWLHCIEGLDPNGGSGGSSGGGNVWDAVQHIRLTSFEDDIFQEELYKSHEDLFDENDELIPFSQTIDPGFYRIEIAHSGLGTFMPEVYFEVKERKVFEVSKADMFDFTVFPVPHQNDYFEINMVSFANLAVVYKLFDSQGNVIHRSNYNLKNNHDADHQITPANPLPTGLLIHRFEFDDGSYKTATSFKNM